jgi:hypothetical protein
MRVAQDHVKFNQQPRFNFEQTLDLLYRCHDDTTRHMPAYEIYFHCNDCQREHPIHIGIHLDNGPGRKENLAEFLRGGSMPPQVMALRGHKALCLKTGRAFKLDSDDQIFLVPTPPNNRPLRQAPSIFDEE